MNKKDLRLEEDDWELQLQCALAEIPPDPAPARLRRTLRRIPKQQRRESRTAWFVPRWAFAASALPLLMAFYLYWGSTAQDDREIAQGRRDLAVALTYIARANQQVSSHISSTVYGGMAKPITDNTRQILQQPLNFVREIQL
jgi:hypothetical protein